MTISIIIHAAWEPLWCFARPSAGRKVEYENEHKDCLRYVTNTRIRMSEGRTRNKRTRKRTQTHEYESEQKGHIRKRTIHPVCCLRFVSDWTQPLDILSAGSEFVVITYRQKGAWATQALEQILDSEFLLCELGVPYHVMSCHVISYDTDI